MNFNLATQQEISAELGVRLRAQRLAQAMPQDELAARAAVSVSTLKRLEKSGAASVEALVRVAQALGLAGGFEPLFALKIQSIAQMEKGAADAALHRAPRRRGKGSGGGKGDEKA